MGEITLTTPASIPISSPIINSPRIVCISLKSSGSYMLNKDQEIGTPLIAESIISADQHHL